MFREWNRGGEVKSAKSYLYVSKYQFVGEAVYHNNMHSITCDQICSLGLMGYEKPAADGSSKTEMAASLRKVLALPFKKGKRDKFITIMPYWCFFASCMYADYFQWFCSTFSATGVHFDKMDGDKFRKSINASWNWLDGKPLCWAQASGHAG